MPEKTHYPQELNGDRLGAHLASEHVGVRNRTRHTDHITLQYCNSCKPDYTTRYIYRNTHHQYHQLTYYYITYF